MAAGDFDDDGNTDLAVNGSRESDTLWVARSTGDGRFSTRAFTSPLFVDSAGRPGAKLVSGDFDGDGHADLALTGVAGWD